MASISLNAKVRTKVGAALPTLRASGRIPAVTYGHGIKPQALDLSAKEFGKVLASAGQSTIVSLAIDGKQANVVISDVQHDPVTGAPTHVDLHQVRMDEKIKAQVPLKFIGTSHAVKDLGGILVKPTDAIEVEALPADLPHEIVVDLSKLEELNSKLTLGDIGLPKGVTPVVADRDFAVASVEPPRSEEELAKLDEAVTEDVEAVEGVKKPVEGEEVSAEGEDGKEGTATAGKGEAKAGEVGAKAEGAAKPEAAKGGKPGKPAGKA
ncbi:MAG: 50S ribosomal protein L25 [Candidatus Andersenbacteria bacterium]